MSDARDLLLRYLEQRREMGETELVLDSLSVEDAMKMLGAKLPMSTGARESAPASERVVERAAPREFSAGGSADWRQTLREAGASPDTMPKKRANADAPSAPTTPPPKPPEVSSINDVAPSGISTGTPTAELLGGSMAHLESLDALAAHVASCTRCPLYSTATNPVPGEGNPNADFMCVGEAPGATEDETGRPFVGAAGQLLTKILGAIDLKREDVFICNVLKHRPPGNRNPRPEEVTACSPYLIRQIDLIKPKVILALGTFAAQTLLDTKLSIGKLRGQVHRYYGVPLIVTYHPAALLRNPGWKRPTWEDVQLARRILDSSNPGA